MQQLEKVCLADFNEDPNNYSHASDEAFTRLVEKIRRVPEGLAAQRIAYVTDDAQTPNKVIAGNKRLRALRQVYGDRAEVPADWFQDVTAMSPSQRRDFAINSNINEGRWISAALRDLMPPEELQKLLDPKTYDEIMSDIARPQIIPEDEELDLSNVSTDITLVIEIPDDLEEAARKILEHYDADDDSRAITKLARLMSPVK